MYIHSSIKQIGTHTLPDPWVCEDSLFLTHSPSPTHSLIHSYIHAHTHRRGSARCSVRPVSVLCWLLCVLVQHVLLMTLIQACFLRCVWAAALSYWHIIPGCGCVELHTHGCYYGTARLLFSVCSTSLIIDDTVPCQAVWVVCCFDPRSGLQGGKWPPDTWRTHKCVCLGGRVHSSGIQLFLESCSEQQLVKHKIGFNVLFYTTGSCAQFWFAAHIWYISGSSGYNTDALFYGSIIS